ncbi:unnamed protein product [Cuscuta europaea]|uniref:Uncharacterized protein n=1 Tax=Cuscuta europaea TaxID=41803 RepID=A0A9P1EFL2_CUSEU|nr:unnamed protein product [Cuscuta europaea]
MFMAIGGGGFFSSSASGCNKGLAFLLLRQKTGEKPMRVTPCNQFELADKETDSDLQLASCKSTFVRSCTSLVCFGRASATERGNPLPCSPSVKAKDQTHSTSPVKEGIASAQNALRSSLKKEANITRSSSESGDKCGEIRDKSNVGLGPTERRKVQWTDTSGGELFEVREFVLSKEDESDNDFDSKSLRSCSCMIM